MHILHIHTILEYLSARLSMHVPKFLEFIKVLQACFLLFWNTPVIRSFTKFAAVLRILMCRSSDFAFFMEPRDGLMAVIYFFMALSNHISRAHYF